MALVAVQLLLLAAVLLAPQHPALPGGSLLKYPGAFFILGGAAVLALAAPPLHRAGSLTPLPRPRPGSALARTGLYAAVRHPLYTGVLCGALGAALFAGGWLNLCAWALLAAALDRKAACEESLLRGQHPDYEAYARAVPKFLPRFSRWIRPDLRLVALALLCALVPLGHAFVTDQTTARICDAADEGAAPRDRAPVFLAPFAFDGYMWNRLALDLGADGQWRLRRTLFDNPPEGREVHWATAFAWALRVMGEGLRAVSDFTLQQAIFRASLWAGPLLLACALAAAVFLFPRRLGLASGAALLLGMLLCPQFYESFLPAAPDHHGAAALCALGMLLGAAAAGAGWTSEGGETPLPGSHAQARRAMIFSALCGGAGLWISAFSILPFLFAAGLGGLCAALAGRAGASGGRVFYPALWRLWGRWGSAAALGFYAIEKFPGGLGMRLEVNHPCCALAWLGAGEILAVIAGRLSGQRAPLQPVRITAGTLALASPAVCALIFGSAVYLPMDPFLRAVHGEIAEFRPLLERLHGGYTNYWAALGLLPLLPAVAILLALSKRAGAAARIACAALTPAGVIAVLLPFFQIRWTAMLGPVAVALAVVLTPAVLRAAAESQPVVRAAVWAGIALLALSCGSVVWGSYLAPAFGQFAQGRSATPTPHQHMALVHRELAVRISRASGTKTPVVLAGPSSAVMLASLGNFRTVGTFYWENKEGLAKSARLMTASNRRRISADLASLGITHVVLMDWENFIAEFQRILRASAPEGASERRRPLWAAVLEGGPPPPGIVPEPWMPPRLRAELGQRGAVLRVK